MGWFDLNAPAGQDVTDMRYFGGSPTFDERAPTGTRGSGEPTSSPYGGGFLPTGSSHPLASGQNWQSIFDQLRAGQPGTPQALIGMEGALGQHGIKVLRNAEGVAGKIQLPDGTIVDVIRAAGAGGGPDNWQWDLGGGAGSSSGSGLPAGYEMGTFTGGGAYPLASVMAPGLMQPWTTPFKAPDDVTQQSDPGWQFRMREGLKAVERSAAAKGTLLTGGTMKDLTRWAQDYASGEYDKVYGRALGEYQQAYNIFQGNQGNQFGRLFNVMGSGQNAAAQTGQFGTAYGANAGNALMGAGNALGSGQQGSANAWAAGVNNAGNLAGQYYWMNQILNPPNSNWLANASSYPAPSAGNVGGPGYPGYSRTPV